MGIPAIEHYAGREQAWVKHYFLASYVERLTYKVASVYRDVVYVDGFSGPWRDQGESFQDTSFGIVLKVLRAAKEDWKRLKGHDVTMTALLVERDPAAYARLQEVRDQYPDINIVTFDGDFVARIPDLLKAMPRNAFSFTLIDPKGWTIDMQAVAPLLRRPNSEVVFNFMFDFINRWAKTDQQALIAGFDRLMPGTDWRPRLDAALATAAADMIPAVRKRVLVDAIGETISRLGNFEHVMETPVFYPLKDRTFYSLIYATRNAVGIEVFRDSQASTLKAQDQMRGELKAAKASAASGMEDLFGVQPVRTDDYAGRFVAEQEELARAALLDAVPLRPMCVHYGDLWPKILTKCGVRKSRLGRVAAELKNLGLLTFLDWDPRKKVPDDRYRLCR